ncbi:MAG: aminotransferase class V-fold PLP-dependent enzyme [Fimbriimonadaceae bacterium]|nr:MAG: aminotransferase class V-fold PLP-dependent enzyme [Fimbriimonadaceae bacterium]
MKLENYFDNAATTALHPTVKEAMLPWMGEWFGNPHSLHSWGSRAKNAVEQARAKIAELLQAEDPSQIIFTSGATESCNTMLSLLSPKDTAVSPFEHSAIRVPAAQKGFTLIPNMGFSLSSSAHNQVITSCCNETGAILTSEATWYSDITQTAGKLPFNLEDTEAAAFSAHKFHGPMGVGGLFIKDPNDLNESNAHQVGGGQEQGRRSGTLNVPGIVGMAKALEIALENQQANLNHATELRHIITDELRSVSHITFNDAPVQSPFILSITIPGLVAQALVIDMDRLGFAISSGAACSSQSTQPSPVLKALGKTDAEALATIRASFAYYNTRDSAFELATQLKSAISSLRN